MKHSILSFLFPSRIKNIVLVQLGIISIFVVAYYLLENYFGREQYFWAFYRYQQLISRILAAILVVHFLGIYYFNKVEINFQLKNLIFSKENPKRLALLRILISVYNLILIGYILFFKQAHWASLPDSSKVALPFIGWLIDVLPVSPFLYKMGCVLALVLTILMLLGWGSKKIQILQIPVLFYLLLVTSSFGKLFHNQITIWLSFILAFSPCYDAYSLNHYFKKNNKSYSSNVSYHFPIGIIWLLLANLYFFSGFYKLCDNGMEWFLGPNSVNVFRIEWIQNYYQVPFFRIDHFPTFCKLGCLIAILFELYFPIMLFNYSTRNFSGIEAILFHIGTYIFLYITFGILIFLFIGLIHWRFIFHSINPKNEWKMVEESANREEILQFKAGHKPLFWGSVILLVCNFSCGAFNIHTYPFSAYPAYSHLAPEYFEKAKPFVYTQNKIYLNLDSIARKNNIRLEELGYMESDILRFYQQKDSVKLKEKLQTYWNIINNRLPELSAADSVSFILYRHGMAPEDWQNVERPLPVAHWRKEKGLILTPR